jgi:hypothetical protein
LRIRIIIPDPGLKQIAEHIQGFSGRRSGFQKAKKLLDGTWPGGIEV